MKHSGFLALTVIAGGMSAVGYPMAATLPGNLTPKVADSELIDAFVTAARTTVFVKATDVKGARPAAILPCGQAIRILPGASRWVLMRYPVGSTDGIGLIRQQDISLDRPPFDTCEKMKNVRREQALR